MATHIEIGSQVFQIPPEVVAFIQGYAERIKALEAALRECADDLELEVKSRFLDSAGHVHPALQSRFERDLGPVKRAREALGPL